MIYWFYSSKGTCINFMMIWAWKQKILNTELPKLPFKNNWNISKIATTFLRSYKWLVIILSSKYEPCFHLWNGRKDLRICLSDSFNKNRDRQSKYQLLLLDLSEKCVFRANSQTDSQRHKQIKIHSHNQLAEIGSAVVINWLECLNSYFGRLLESECGIAWNWETLGLQSLEGVACHTSKSLTFRTSTKLLWWKAKKEPFMVQAQRPEVILVNHVQNLFLNKDTVFFGHVPEILWLASPLASPSPLP